MKRKTSLTYIFIFVVLLALLSIPKDSTEKLQGATVAMFSPLWNKLFSIKNYNASSNTLSSTSSEEFQKIQLENSLLREEIIHIKNSMQHELNLLAQMEALVDQQKNGMSTKILKKRHRAELQKLLKIQHQVIPARVIFRSPSSWNSSLWLDVGSSTNESSGTQTIAKNSPVLLGTAVIGVIDYVGKNQARVRLITDSGLTPSVRAVRGNVKNFLIREKLREVIQLLYSEGDAFSDPQQHEALITNLQTASEGFFQDESTSYLAKGEVHGSSKPLWRTQRNELKGIGFNYDFTDGLGPARDLRTGKPLDTTSDQSTTPIVKAGDVLVTTGLDGVFPPGLLVAEVTKVHALKEGDYYYELDALPVAGNLDTLSLVFVIPPVGYDESEQPNSFEWK